MAPTITLQALSATATARKIGMQGPGHRALALGRLGSRVISRGLLVKLVRDPEWASEITGWSWVSQITAGNRHITQRGTDMERILAMEGETVTIRSRPKDPEGEILYLADVDTALVQVFDTTATARSTPLYSENLVLSEVLYAGLQVDKGWRTDASGYSFKYELPADVLREGGRVYRIEVILRTKTRGPSSIVHEVETSSLWTSRASLGV
jgi:hypothetical protein